MDPDNAGYAREDPVYVFAEDIGGKEIGIIAALLSVWPQISFFPPS